MTRSRLLKKFRQDRTESSDAEDKNRYLPKKKTFTKI